MLAIFLALLGKIPITAILNMGKAVIDNIKRYWQYWLIALLVVSTSFCHWEWRHTYAMLTKERAAHAADIASFKKAQADANTHAQAERDRLLKEAKANAKQADTHYTNLLSQYHASILRYKASQSGTWKSGDSQLPTTQSGDGPSASTDLPATITISGSDAQICAVNTARLQAVHDWAVNLPK